MSAVPFLETTAGSVTTVSFDLLDAAGGVDSIAEVEIDASGSQRIVNLYADDGAGSISYSFVNVQVGTPNLPLWMPYPMEATPDATSADVLAYLADFDPTGDPNALAYVSDAQYNGSATTLAYLSDPIVRAPAYNPVTALPWEVLLWADGPGVSSLADGAPVASWTDETTHGRSATQATASARPVLHRNVAGWNGRSAITFDGVDDFLGTAAFATALPQPVTLVVIGKVATFKGTQQNLTSGVGTNKNLALAASNTGTWMFNAGSNILRGTADTGKHLFTALASGPNSAITVDGKQVGNVGGAGTNPTGGLRVGTTVTGGGYLGGDVAFVGVVPGALTAAQLSDLHTWAQSSYGTP